MGTAFKIVRWTGVVAGACVVAAFATAWLVRIEPLLPPVSGSTCFSASFAGTDALRLGWHREKRTDTLPVARMTLRLDHPEGQEPYRDRMSGYRFAWRYSLKLDIVSVDGARYRGEGAYCDWSNDAISHVEPSLACHIDCDGGSIWLSRAPGRSAIDVEWDAKSWLRMSACGGGGEILRAGDISKTFRLAQVPAETCSSMRAPRD
jgi:hypothetical protein